MSGSNFLTNRSHRFNGTSTADDRPIDFTVTFWGVRGTVPTPGSETARYGGNTACVEIKVGGKRLIFDGGTGLRALGKRLLYESPAQAHLFFTHTHWDRIQGFPFFMPAYVEGNRFDIYGAMGANGASIKQRLSDQMLRPNFSVPMQAMRSHLEFRDIAPGAVIQIEDVVIETIALNRSNGALGYRITWNGCSVVYATDTEAVPGHPDQGLLYLAQQADLLIYDIASSHSALPDSSAVLVEQQTPWKAGLEVAIAAQVKQLVLFHHEPDHEDDFLDRIERETQHLFAPLQFAREGTAIQVIPQSMAVAEDLSMTE